MDMFRKGGIAGGHGGEIAGRHGGEIGKIKGQRVLDGFGEFDGQTVLGGFERGLLDKEIMHLRQYCLTIKVHS